MAGNKRVPARARASKQVVAQGFTKKQWVILGICVAAVVVLVIAFFLLRDLFDGSLKVVNGVVQAEDNWIFVNANTDEKPKYFKLGEIQPVEGYAQKVTHYTSDEKVPTYFFEPKGDSPVESVSVLAARGGAKEMAEKVAKNYGAFFGGAVSSEVTQREIGGRTGWGFVCTYESVPSSETESDKKPGRVASVYFDAPHGMSVLVNTTATAADTASLTDEATLYAVLEPFARNLTIEGEAARGSGAGDA